MNATATRSPMRLRTGIAVSVGLRPPLTPLATGGSARDLSDRVQARLDDLLADLGMSATTGVEVMALERGDGPGASPYHITLHGRACRLPLNRRDPSPATPAALARAIAEDLCHNRALLLTPSIAGEIQRAWAGERGLALALETFHDLLAWLVGRGS